MRLRSQSFAALSALAALAFACGDSRKSTLGLAERISCVSCHGGQDNDTGAPPFDLDGASDTALATVGAHTAHVQGSLASPFGCAECHEDVPRPATPGHMDGKVDLPFGALSRTGGVTPAFDPGTMSCGTTYCHGATLQGGTHTTPVWTKVGQGEAACGTCHAVPPATGLHSFHVTSRGYACGACHPAPGGAAAVDPATHVNGVLDLPFPFAALSRTRGVTPVFDPTTQSCSSTYCHGNFAGGNLYNVPRWNGTQAACGTCHGIPPLTGQHDFHVNSKGYACNACHSPSYSAATVDPAVHVNGVKDVPSGIANWNPATKTCNAACHTGPPAGMYNPAPWYF